MPTSVAKSDITDRIGESEAARCVGLLAHGAAYREKKIKKKRPTPQPSAVGLADYVSVVVIVVI